MATPTTSFFLLPLFFVFVFLLPGSDAVFDVVKFGAKADGSADSARSFLKAWSYACNSPSPATVYVPAGKFLVTQAVFRGPCRNSMIKFLIQGTLVAPSDYGGSGGSDQWIAFSGVNGVSISGGGTLDGGGSRLWACKLAGRSCPSGTSSLTFANSKNIAVDGLTSINSKLFHIVVLRCQNVKLIRVNIVASGNSPNTDGIHVQMSTGVDILQANIRTGDDCISIGPGTAHLWIERVFCGPGHGISIGSLGKAQGLQEESVRNVTVKTVTFSGTQNGVRIKTWGTRIRGQVRGVVFEDALMRNVQNPIIIDQNYCPGNKGCPGQSSGIKISQVKYNNIRGTSATPVAVTFDCSPSNPCSGITLQDIKLSYHSQRAQSSCKYANGVASGGEEMVRNKQVVLKKFAVGVPKETDMEIRQGKASFRSPTAVEGAIVVKNLYLSCDPYMRGRMRDYADSYIPPFQPGSVIEGFGVAKVVDSTNPNFCVGDYITGLTGWEEYSTIVRTEQVRKIEVFDVPLSYHVGLLGMTGFTAYVGFYEICAPKKGDYVFVSAASGAVGQLVGQLAKLHGCYVVGSAGSAQKVDLLKNKLGFDEAFNYKEEPDLTEALRSYFPKGIDIYFDNVGGAMLDAALLNMRVHGRVAVCGMVSQHAVSDPKGISNLYTLVMKRIRMEGFIQSDHLHLFPKFLSTIIDLYKQGRIVYIEDMNEGLENGPEAFVGLFTGNNVGKQVVCVSRE
ncbi:Zinc-binding dehydrogenase [Musa troglodytarum]|uniref:Exopolygalacturonase n=1 Tax=Musa troglodytarum TaxID=320322 RepID=A0A9E7H856_9LILI|nr:Zinc-binding dehydrogenase [Musa troglodytarum]